MLRITIYIYIYIITEYVDDANTQNNDLENTLDKNSSYVTSSNSSDENII